MAGAPRAVLFWPKAKFECAVPDGREAHMPCVAPTVLAIPGVLGSLATAAALAS